MLLVARRLGVELGLLTRTATAKPQRSIAMSLSRPQDLARNIADVIRSGATVVLMDADYNSQMFGEMAAERTVKVCVEDQLTPREKALAKVINVDDHAQELTHLTAAQLAFQQLEKLREVEGEIVIIINHGDADSLISSFIAYNLDRDFSVQEKELLIAAARISDLGEGDSLAPIEQLPPAARLSQLLSLIAMDRGLEYPKLLRSQETEIDAQGIAAAHDLINRVLVEQGKVLFTSEVEATLEKYPARDSFNKMQAVSDGKNVTGISLYREPGIENYPIVVVDSSQPDLDRFDPIAAYKASSRPAIILFQRQGRITGLGVNPNYSEWLNLTEGIPGRVEGFYSRSGGKYKGQPYGGGANVAPDQLLKPAEAIQLAAEFIKDSLPYKPVV